MPRLTPEVWSGALLLGATIVALVWSNLTPSYFTLWNREIFSSFEIGDLVNELLISLFFLLVSIEIKHELNVGHLSHARKASLPVAAAFGGMLVPALIYLAFNSHSTYERGWGIPMATDIAFTLGVLRLVGRKIPAALIVFVSALAIADDLGAVAVIAIFYNHKLDVPMLIFAAMVALVIYVQSRRFRSPVFTTALGLILWWLVRSTGMHATIAGVALGFILPFDPKRKDPVIQTLRKPVDLFVLPLFALANAGVPLAMSADRFVTPVFLGTALGLFLGKPIGISLFSFVAIKSRIAELGDIRWRQLVGAAILCGIGFTMSLFIAELGLEGSPDAYNTGKLAVLTGSIVSGIIGYSFLAFLTRKKVPPPMETAPSKRL